MGNYKKLQQKLQENKCVANYDLDELEYLKTPIGKTNYNTPPTKTWTDRIICEICNKEYARSCVTAHRKTQVHQAYLNINKKFVGLLHKKNI